MKFRKKIAPVLVTVMTAVLFTGCGDGAVQEETAVEEAYTPVETQVISLGSISKNLSYQGYVEANQTVNVTSKLSGIVENVYFDEGDFVNAGDTLFTIDQKDINDNISSLEASLKVSEQSVASAQTGLNQASGGGQTQASRLQLENAVKSAQINVETCTTSLENAKTSIASAQKALETYQTSLETAQATLANTEKTYNDTKKLYEAGVVAKNDFDSVELGYTQAKNAVIQAQNAVETAQNSVTQAQNAKVQAEKALENAQNTLAQAQDSLSIFDNSTSKDSVDTAQNSVNTAIASKNATQTQIDIAKSSLADTVVKAPISGYITKRNIEPSNMVSAQSAPFTIVDVSTVTVNVNISEKIINNISVGDTVEVEIDALANKNITGTVKTVSPVADSTNTYPVKVEIENPDGAIKAGMFAKVNFTEIQNDDAVVLPVDVVLISGEKSYVYTVDGEGRAVKTEVETGLDNGTDVQITNGLNVGDTVIVNGQNYVEDGSLVKVITDAETETVQESTEKAQQ